MRLGPLALLVIVATALGSAEAREWKRIRIATDGHYPPFSRIDADGRPVGYDVDVARAVCARLGAECEITAPGWDALVPSLRAGRVDLLVASQPITEEARRLVEFTAAYHRIAPRFVGRDRAAPSDPGPHSAKGLRIGVRTGTAHAVHLAALYAPAGATISNFATEPEALEALAAGHVDLVFGDALTLFDLLDHDFAGRHLRFVGRPVDNPRHFGAGAGIAFRREDADLGRSVDQALAELDRDGSLERIAGRWFPFAIR
ncbi:MAG: transporter substrate-binding domain-containing protein [Siculibacillus sp.]|nr:transporter substrate-binding domain-containing protein [Siculibacillus sp.]